MMGEREYLSHRCLNPFQRSRHKLVSPMDLRIISVSVCQKLGIPENKREDARLCSVCRKRVLGSQVTAPIVQESVCETEQSTGSDSDVIPSCSVECDTGVTELEKDEAILHLNETLKFIGDSPGKKQKISHTKYSKSKLQKINTSLENKIFEQKESTESDQGDEQELLDNLKNIFSNTQDRNSKFKILTLLPLSWSVSKIQSHFYASKHMIRTAKGLAREGKIMCTPEKKKGKSLPQSTVKLVTDFYESEEVSRMMPGKKDFVTIRKGNVKEQIQKKLVLCNLSELYRNFKDKYPTCKIGFSKFAELRPEHCVLAGSSGTHAVCVCAIHENTKLMISGAKLSDLTDKQNFPIDNYKECIARIICNPPLPSCYIGNCNECPGTIQLKNDLHTAFEEAMVDTVTYKQWIAADKTTLETIEKNTEEFIDEFIKKLVSLKMHSFIATQQSEYYNEIKKQLFNSIMHIC